MIKSPNLDSKADRQPATNNNHRSSTSLLANEDLSRRSVPAQADQLSIPSASGRVVLTKEESSKLDRGRRRTPAATTEIPHSALPTPHSELALVAKADQSSIAPLTKEDEV